MSGLPDTLVHRVRPADGDPEGALVLLHGRGADENDLFGLLDVLDPQRKLVGITPGGPLFLPPGGRHWYVVPRVGFPDPATFHDSYRMLGDFLRGVDEATGVPLGADGGRRLLAGHGHVLRPRPRRRPPLARGDHRPQRLHPDRRRLDAPTSTAPGCPCSSPTGARDPIMAIDFARDAQQRLSQAGLDVTYRESDAAHHVDPRTLQELPGFIDEALVRAQASS